MQFTESQICNHQVPSSNLGGGTTILPQSSAVFRNVPNFESRSKSHYSRYTHFIALENRPDDYKVSQSKIRIVGHRIAQIR